MLKRWLKAVWTAWTESFDPDEVGRGSQPAPMLFAIVSLSAVLSVIAFVPPMSVASQFERPWVSLGLTLMGGVFTTIAGRANGRGLAGQIGTLFDNAFYSAALIWAACSTSSQYAMGLAIVHGLMVLSISAQAYGLTLLFALVYATPLALLLVVTQVSVSVALILVCTYILVLFTSYLTRRRQELTRRNKQLVQAVAATHRVADESVQTALTTTLLSLGNFLHELKSYQASVRTNLTFLAETIDADQDGRDAITEAISAQEGEIKLVRSTMDSLMRSAKPRDEEFELQTLIHDVAKGTVGVHVSESSSSGAVRVKGVAEHLTIVLTNLIRNADQAGATRVWIETAPEPGGHSVRVIVRDDGPGMPPTVTERLFEPFGATTKKGGTGLGLYLCRRHVELFGGTIRIEKTGPTGTVFVILLPSVMSDLPSRAPDRAVDLTAGTPEPVK